VPWRVEESSRVYRPPLIIPVENQVRELDPKLLLAVVAARRGFTSYIGSHRVIDLRIDAFPRGLYLNKSMTARNIKMFEIMRRLGQVVVSWDEEALVHLPAEIYYSRRLSPVALGYLSHLFVWGEDNAELWRAYPEMPSGLPIHVTGNPRNDLLRPQMRGFYREEAEAIRERYGDFILVNTNFNHVNAFFPGGGLFRPPEAPDVPAELGQGGMGMPREFAEGLRDHKQAIFDAFLGLVPRIAQSFSGVSVVIRPHPTENQEVYRRVAAAHEGVHVSNEGNVVPWLLAARALVHNGCTTGVEAYALGLPGLAFRPVVNPVYDDTFYRLPNGLSHQCFSESEVESTLQEVMAGRLGPPEGAERQALLSRYLAAMDGPLACERMVEVLEGVAERFDDIPRPPLLDRLSGRVRAKRRLWSRKTREHRPGPHAPPEFHRHRYPGVTIEDLRRRIDRFQQLLGDAAPIRAEAVREHVFHIRPA